MKKSHWLCKSMSIKWNQTKETVSPEEAFTSVHYVLFKRPSWVARITPTGQSVGTCSESVSRGPWLIEIGRGLQQRINWPYSVDCRYELRLELLLAIESIAKENNNKTGTESMMPSFFVRWSSRGILQKNNQEPGVYKKNCMAKTRDIRRGFKGEES